METGAFSSSGKGLTPLSTATWVRVPATGELTFRHRQGQRTDTWQHVTSLDHLCGARIPLYNSKKKRSWMESWSKIRITMVCKIHLMAYGFSDDALWACDLLVDKNHPVLREHSWTR